MTAHQLLSESATSSSCDTRLGSKRRCWLPASRCSRPVACLLVPPLQTSRQRRVCVNVRTSGNEVDGRCMLVGCLAARTCCCGKRNKREPSLNCTTHLVFRGPYFSSCSESSTVAQSPTFYHTLMICGYASLDERLVVGSLLMRYLPSQVARI